MSVESLGPETIALSSIMHPSKLEENKSIAEKTRNREEPKPRSIAGEDRGQKIDIDV